MTQTEKELLIGAIENLLQYGITFSPKEGEHFVKKDYSIVAQINNSINHFYIAFKKEKLAYIYQNLVKTKPPKAFREYKRNDTLFDIYCFCIEHEIPFHKNNYLLSITTPNPFFIDPSNPSKEDIKLLQKNCR